MSEIMDQPVETQIAELLSEGMGDDDSKPEGAAGDEGQAPEDTGADDPGIGDLLAGEDTPNDDVEDQDTEGEGDTDSEPFTVKDLAEQLGVEAKDLYDELTIPLDNGESLTLGEFKDRAKDLRELDGLREQVNERKSETERDTIAIRAEMQQLLEMIPAEMRTQLVSASAARHTEHLKEQSAAILESIPEWKDHDTLARDRDAIIGVGQEYGFSDVEMTSTYDSRTVKMLHDFVKLRERVKTAESMDSKKVKKKAPGQPGRRNRTGKATKLRQRIAAAKKGSMDDAQAVVSQLIREQL